MNKLAQSNDPILGQFESTIKFQSLRYQCGQVMWCRGCDTCLDCNDAVSLDFIGQQTGKLYLTLCLCGKCADGLDTSSALAKGEAKAKEPLREERFDGRDCDEDGFPIGAKPTIGQTLQPFSAKLKTGRKEVHGYSVTFEGFEGFEFFVYQMTRDDGTPGNWFVVEKISGMGASGGGNDTIAKAVAKARQNINKAGIEKLRQLVESHSHN